VELEKSNLRDINGTLMNLQGKKYTLPINWEFQTETDMDPHRSTRRGA